jgi:hypothetical protein
MFRGVAVELSMDYLLGRVALTLPDLLNRRKFPLQSQPQILQYHSVMPSHSSRSARTARPALMERWSDGVMGAWRTGTTFDAPHSGQRGGFLAVGFFPVTGHVS